VEPEGHETETRVRALAERARAWPLAARLGASFLALVLTVALDTLTPPQLNWSLLYLAPVVMAAALISRGAGLVFAALSTVIWMVAESVFQHLATSAWVAAWNTGMRFAVFAVVAWLVGSLARAHAHESALARTDPLTGLANRRVFAEHLERALAQTSRIGRPSTVAILDLDDFKNVNDRRGHAEGDRVLQLVARAIAGNVRGGDLVTRFGGDEFAVLMPNTDADVAVVVLERLLRGIRDACAPFAAVGATAGAVTAWWPPERPETLLGVADQQLYRAKQEARGRVMVAKWPEGPAKPPWAQRTAADAAASAFERSEAGEKAV